MTFGKLNKIMNFYRNLNKSEIPSNEEIEEQLNELQHIFGNMIKGCKLTREQASSLDAFNNNPNIQTSYVSSIDDEQTLRKVA